MEAQLRGQVGDAGRGLNTKRQMLGEQVQPALAVPKSPRGLHPRCGLPTSSKLSPPHLSQGSSLQMSLPASAGSHTCNEKSTSEVLGEESNHSKTFQHSKHIARVVYTWACILQQSLIDLHRMLRYSHCTEPLAKRNVRCFHLAMALRNTKCENCGAASGWLLAQVSETTPSGGNM